MDRDEIEYLTTRSEHVSVFLFAIFVRIRRAHCVGTNAHAFDARTSNAHGSDAHALDTSGNPTDV